MSNKKVLATLIVTSCFAIFLMGSSVVNAFSTTIINPQGEKNIMFQLMPQGWGFFSSPPRDEQFVILDKDLNLAADWPNMKASNLFGINRDGRAHGIEAGVLYQQAFANEQQCDTTLKDCVDLQNTVEITNDSPRPAFCGEYVIAQMEAVPWTWAGMIESDEMSARFIEVDVSC